ncbi:monovalent cation/H+ antiporter complex subunit F [Actinoalloteichus hymeniacidonis]|uniref:Multisubunit sodium/proton antiporter, MrpF subunit n=1 Tax=Actinoalloteichus hymeniacidonis TaxID=340345 RepID=A0AAC9HUW6_9PSEU|nr:monovalent cation/H+ antiporter complex subunit F [Actinoalloteichus hymeniacidonis]AOS65576.1 multisubunit sodium/proton antiporter, MrpF subunit [Actinoalloteichus hymeniacidonis]MBB5906334.1 multicomponent Na+:H+ antiporter subunit F [Actinoalloteichus hymeniacidonis]
MEIVFAITLALICVAGLIIMVRLVRGPTTLDRIVAVDVLVILIVGGTAVNMAGQGDGSNVALLVAVALLGFIGSMTVVRLVERKGTHR